MQKEVALPVKVIARALEAHVELDKITGTAHHHLTHAALAARSSVGERRFLEAMAANKLAGGRDTPLRMYEDKD